MSGRMISRRSVLALAACTALGAVGCSKTEEYTGPELILRYAENQPEDYPTTQAALAFADLVAERTEGRVKVVVYSGGELGAEQTPRLDVFNKCDRYLGDIRPHGEDIVSISARTGEGVEELLDVLDGFLPQGPQLFPEDMVTDQPERQMMAEILREKLLLCLDKEIPHGTAVEITKFSERDDEVIEIDATIYCEKNSHKGIIIGKGGAMLKKVSSLARQDMERFMGTKVYLQTWVKVKENWRDNVNLIRNFGYRDE